MAEVVKKLGNIEPMISTILDTFSHFICKFRSGSEKSKSFTLIWYVNRISNKRLI